MANIPPSIPGIDPCIVHAFTNLFDRRLPIRSLALNCETRVLTDHVYLQLLAIMQETSGIQRTSLEGRGQKITLTDRIITINQEALNAIAFYLRKVPSMNPHLDLPISFRALAGNTIPNEWLAPDPVVSSDAQLREMNETLKQILARLMASQEAQARPAEDLRSAEMKREQEPEAPQMPLLPLSHPFANAPGLRTAASEGGLRHPLTNPPMTYHWHSAAALAPAYAHPGGMGAPAAAQMMFPQPVEMIPIQQLLPPPPVHPRVGPASVNLGVNAPRRNIGEIKVSEGESLEEQPAVERKKRSRHQKGDSISHSPTSAHIVKGEQK